MYIQRRQTLINAVRPLARDESAVFLLYLPTVNLFLSRLFAQPSSCALPIPNAGFLFQNAQFRTNLEEKLAYLKKK